MCLICETPLAKLFMNDIFKASEINLFSMLSNNPHYSIIKIKLIITGMNSKLSTKIKALRSRSNKY